MRKERGLKMLNFRIIKNHLTERITILIFAVLSISGCETVSGNSSAGIGFREARFAEMAAMRDYRSCRDQALVFDTKARTTGSKARYLASARFLEKCEKQIGREIGGVDNQERMQAYALSIQNYFKGGDLQQARTKYKTFKKAFPDQDLYYPNGSSFSETLEILLGLKDEHQIGNLSTANISMAIKADLRRARYWKTN